MVEDLYLALTSLNGDEMYVVASTYWADQTEARIADELTRLRGTPHTREWVHRRKLTALAKLRRALADIRRSGV